MYTIVLIIVVLLASGSFFYSKDNYKQQYPHQTWFDKWKHKKEKE